MQVDPKSMGKADELLQLVQLFIVIEHVRQTELHETHWELIKNKVLSLQLRQEVADVHVLQLFMQTIQTKAEESG